VPLLGRKVTGTQWARKADLGHDEVAADTVTKELRTTHDTLSFWCAADDTEPWKSAALAMGAAAERLDSLDIAWIDREALVGDGVQVVDSLGETPVADLRDKHADACRLDAFRLARVATHVARAVRSEPQQLRRVTRTELIAMVSEAVRADRVRLEDLNENVRKEVQAKLAGK